jgi:hypothetical protein
MSAICASKQFRATAEMTQDAKYPPRADAFRFAPELGHCSTHPPLRLCATSGLMQRSKQAASAITISQTRTSYFAL